MTEHSLADKTATQDESCCETKTGGHAQHQHGSSTGLLSSAKATMHCLTGCTIGEVLGLLIGVSAGFRPLYTIMLAVFLAFAIGFAMAIRSVQASEGLGFVSAFKAIWLGEVVSMGIMELVMNVVDYSVGGMQSGSIFTGVFWLGIALAIPAGFLAAWPVNYWLLSKEIKKCCH